MAPSTASFLLEGSFSWDNREELSCCECCTAKGIVPNSSYSFCRILLENTEYRNNSTLTPQKRLKNIYLAPVRVEIKNKSRKQPQNKVFSYSHNKCLLHEVSLGNRGTCGWKGQSEAL